MTRSCSMVAASLVIVRHGERTDYVTDGWTAAAPRPWDPPLTPKGHEQATLAGAAIAAHLEAHGLPPVSEIYTVTPPHPLPPPSRRSLTLPSCLQSPLLRCAETAIGIAAEVGVSTVAPDIDLVETICENWCLLRGTFL